MGSPARVIFKDEIIFCQLERLRFGMNWQFFPLPFPAPPSFNCHFTTVGMSRFRKHPPVYVLFIYFLQSALVGFDPCTF